MREEALTARLDVFICDIAAEVACDCGRQFACFHANLVLQQRIADFLLDCGEFLVFVEDFAVVVEILFDLLGAGRKLLLEAFGEVGIIEVCDIGILAVGQFDFVFARIEEILDFALIRQRGVQVSADCSALDRVLRHCVIDIAVSDCRRIGDFGLKAFDCDSFADDLIDIGFTETEGVGAHRHHVGECFAGEFAVSQNERECAVEILDIFVSDFLEDAACFGIVGQAHAHERLLKEQLFLRSEALTEELGILEPD